MLKALHSQIIQLCEQLQTSAAQDKEKIDAHLSQIKEELDSVYTPPSQAVVLAKEAQVCIRLLRDLLVLTRS
jgi:hypothetical protein